MRVLLALILSFFIAVPATVCAVPAVAGPLVHTEGKRFINPDGTVLHIRGINLGNWLVPEGYMFKFKDAKSPTQIYAGFERLLGPDGAIAFWKQYRDSYITRADIDFIKSVGFNTVRIPLHWRLFMNEEGEITGEGWALLDRVLGWIRDAELVAVLDLHAAPGGQTGYHHDDGAGFPMLFYVPRYHQMTVKLWRAIAQRYAGDPAILGYEVLNEPIAPFHDTATLNPRLDSFYREVTAAIRAVDPGRVVFLSAGQWSTRFDMLGAPFADNLAYTYHVFWSSTQRDSIQRHMNFGARYDVPLLLGETGEFTDAWNAAFRQLHEQLGLGWAFWSYKNMDTPSTVVSVTRPEGWNDIAAYIDGAHPEKPPQATIDRAISDYLNNILLRNGTVRWSYLDSLGLRGEP